MLMLYIKFQDPSSNHSWPYASVTIGQSDIYLDWREDKFSDIMMEQCAVLMETLTKLFVTGAWLNKWQKQ